MDIREILGISEMYEFIRYLKDIIFDKQRREEYFNKIIEDIDLRTDFIRDVSGRGSPAKADETGLYAGLYL